MPEANPAATLAAIRRLCNPPRPAYLRTRHAEDASLLRRALPGARDAVRPPGKPAEARRDPRLAPRRARRRRRLGLLWARAARGAPPRAPARGRRRDPRPRSEGRRA